MTRTPMSPPARACMSALRANKTGPLHRNFIKTAYRGGATVAQIAKACRARESTIHNIINN